MFGDTPELGTNFFSPLVRLPVVPHKAVAEVSRIGNV